MKILLYNIGYGTGLKGSVKEYFLRFWRYLIAPRRPFKKIVSFLKKERADVICLLETDTGSLRTGFKSQVKEAARRLLTPFWRSDSRYHPDSWLKRLPIFQCQHNAIFSKKRGKIFRHYFKNGMSNLVHEFVINNISIFVVHLSVLRKNVRKLQLKELSRIVKKCRRPHMICGDFNIFDGMKEIRGFIRENALKIVQKKATFPAFDPVKPFDLIFACRKLKVKATGVFKHVLHSDHLPVWVEIES